MSSVSIEKLLINLIEDIIFDCHQLMIDIFEKVLSEVGFASGDPDFYRPIKKTEIIFLDKTSHLNAKERSDIRRALIAKIGLYLWRSLDKLNVPCSVAELYPRAFMQLEQYLRWDAINGYGPENDFYCKDLRFVLGLSFPCGAQMVDVTKLYPYSIILSTLRSRRFYPAYLYMRAKGYGNWLGIHTDTRNLVDFNEKGWDQCYIRIAKFLEQRESVRGMVGTSWFYDPQLLKISPNLSYLQQNPLNRGAFQLRHGTGKVHIERATLTSKTRKRLYKEGKYTPVAHSIVWPRKELINWANTQ